jgi:hypothetical protein
MPMPSCWLPQGAKNVFSAREFVWWYNGHPDAAKLPVDMTRVESVAVCGIGAARCLALTDQQRRALAKAAHCHCPTSAQVDGCGIAYPG